MLGSIHEGPDAIDPAEALLREVGAHLREARRERGKEIADVAEILRIQPGYLAGLEQGDLAVIPGRTYALGFLRSYAQYLGFDGNDLIAQIRSSVGPGGAAALQGRAPLSESRLPKIPILVVSLAVLAGAYAGWAYVQGARTVPELVEEVPQELQEHSRSLFETGSQAAPLEASRASFASTPAAGEPRREDRPSALIDTPSSARPPVLAPSASARAEPQAPPPRAATAAALTREMVPAMAAGVRAHEESAVEPGFSKRVPAPKRAPAPATETIVAPNAALTRHVVPAIAPALAVAPAPAVAPARSSAERVAGSASPERDPLPMRSAAHAAATSTATEATATRPIVPALAVASEPDPVAAFASAEQAPALSLEPEGPEVREPEVALVVPVTRAPGTYGTESAGTRVVLRARSQAWVHISSTNNDYLWVQTLRPGDSFIVPDRPDLVLWTGNAGGVEVLVDGAPLPPLGPDAVVVREVSLQPRDLLRRLLPLPTEDAGVSDLASTAKPPMLWRSSR